MHKCRILETKVLHGANIENQSQASLIRVILQELARWLDSSPERTDKDFAMDFDVG